MSWFNKNAQEMMERLQPIFLEVELVTDTPKLIQIKCGRNVNGKWGKDFCIVNVQHGEAFDTRQLSPWSVCFSEPEGDMAKYELATIFDFRTRNITAYAKTLWGLLLLIKRKHPEYCK